MKIVKSMMRTILMGCFVFMNVFTIAQAEKVEKIETENVTVKVERCNVQALPSDEDEISYEYDFDKYEVNVADEDEHKHKVIEISIKENARVRWGDRFIIHIPKDKFESLTFSVERGALSLGEMEADVDVDIERGALAIKTPKGVEHSLTIKADRSAVGITLWDDENFSFEAEIERSALSYPRGWARYYNDGDYEYSKGEGESKIELQLERSSCSIK